MARHSRVCPPRARGRQDTRERVPAAGALAGACLATVLAFSGCTSGGGGEGSAASTTTAPVAAVPPPAAAGEIDACGLLTVDEVADAIGVSAVATEPWLLEPENSPATAGCTFTSEAPESLSKAAVSVTVHPDARTARFTFDDIMRRNDYENVPGLGDRAFTPLEDLGDFEVLVGAYWLAVSVEIDGGSDDDDPIARGLTESVVARLPK